jgi:drug/metabolite transporter (DMT)-like permease
VGIALGLGAAVSWGLADYFAAIASRQISAQRVVLGFHLVAMVLLGVLVAATGALGPLASSQLPYYLLIGAIGWLSYLAFYGALEIGPISVVSPIVSGYAVVAVLLAVAIQGESLGAGTVAAVAMVIAGVIASSADIAQLRGVSLRGHQAFGLLLAVVAMALIGGFVFGVSYHRERLDWLAPIFLARGFATLFLLAQGARTGLRWPVRSTRLLAIVALIGCVDTAGYACFNLGVEHAATSVVATASAPYALIPIAAGMLLLHERPTLVQRAGAALVIGGLLVLGLTQ